MRVLLDESVPRQLAPLLIGHSVTTVPGEGWAGISDGELLRRAASRFDALITGDQSLRHQQSLAGLDLGIVVLVAADNRVETIVALRDPILDVLARLGPGEVIGVRAPRQSRPLRDSDEGS